MQGVCIGFYEADWTISSIHCLLCAGCVKRVVRRGKNSLGHRHIDVRKSADGLLVVNFASCKNTKDTVSSLYEPLYIGIYFNILIYTKNRKSGYRDSAKKWQAYLNKRTPCVEIWYGGIHALM